MSRKCRNVKKKSPKQLTSWEIDLERKYKRGNWEIFQSFLNHETGYTPRTRNSIFDIISDIINKHLYGLEYEKTVDGIKELYFSNEADF